MNAKEPKRNLRILKQFGVGIEKITFVSRRLRQILKSGDKDDNRISSNIDLLTMTVTSKITSGVTSNVLLSQKPTLYHPLLKLSAFHILNALSLP